MQHKEEIFRPRIFSPSEIASIPLQFHTLDLGSCLVFEYVFHIDYIKDMFNKIPPHIITLNLSHNFSYIDNDIDRIKELLLCIPSSIKILNLSENFLFKLEDDLESIFAAIPANIHTLILKRNNLNYLQNLGTVLKMASNNKRTLDLSDNNLGYFDGDLAQHLALISADVKELNLSDNQLCRKSCSTLASITRALQNIEILNLEDNDLFSSYESIIKSGSELALIFESMPQYLSTLNLRCNSTMSLFTDFHLAIAKIPTQIKILDLSVTYLEDEPVELTKKIITAMPSTVNYLILSRNGIFGIHDSQLSDIFALLKCSILDLSYNNPLVYHKETNYYKALKDLSQTVTTLILHELDFGYGSNEFLYEIFHVLPINVTTLDLSDNDFYKKNPQQLKEFLNALPLNITKVILKENRLFKQNTQKTDEYLTELSQVRSTLELDISHNGEGNFARVFAPMVSAAAQTKLPGFIALNILSYFEPQILIDTQVQYFPVLTQTYLKKLNNNEPNLPGIEYTETFAPEAIETQQFIELDENVSCFHFLWKLFEVIYNLIINCGKSQDNIVTENQEEIDVDNENNSHRYRRAI